MPRKAKDPNAKTAAEKALEAAKEKHRHAVEANTKNSTATTVAAVKTAREALDKAITADNRDRFKRVAGNRVTKALTALDNLVKVANPRSYEFTQADVEKFMPALKERIKEIDGAFARALSNSGDGEKTKETFAFD